MTLKRKMFGGRLLTFLFNRNVTNCHAIIKYYLEHAIQKVNETLDEETYLIVTYRLSFRHVIKVL